MDPRKERVVDEFEVFVSDVHAVEVGIVGGVVDIQRG